jgi:hypothetical protein
MFLISGDQLSQMQIQVIIAAIEHSMYKPAIVDCYRKNFNCFSIQKQVQMQVH